MLAKFVPSRAHAEMKICNIDYRNMETRQLVLILLLMIDDTIVSHQSRFQLSYYRYCEIGCGLRCGVGLFRKVTFCCSRLCRYRVHIFCFRIIFLSPLGQTQHFYYTKHHIHQLVYSTTSPNHSN